MAKVTTDGRTLTPWSDVSRILSNAKTLRIKVNGTVFAGLMTLEIDDARNVRITVEPEVAKTAADVPRAMGGKRARRP
ncbi:MAG: hypothetical protein Q8R44_02510 [Novosphingobium sp.]|nr:hypothetical protein [Novosphingobium sp.]